MDNWRDLTRYDDLTDMDQIPEQLKPILALYRWSVGNTWSDESHYTPFSLFLDLTNWSLDNFGELMFQPGKDRLYFGHLEADLLADALSCYAVRPLDVTIYIDKLMEAELND